MHVQEKVRLGRIVKKALGHYKVAGAIVASVKRKRQQEMFPQTTALWRKTRQERRAAVERAYRKHTLATRGQLR